MDLKEFITGYKGKDIPPELKEFNWGAFLLTFIWGIKYKAWITLLAIPLFFIQMPLGFNWVLLFALQIYCGIKGNEWAYQVEYWKKPADFRKTQTKWAVTAILLNIIVPLMIISSILRFINKSPDNMLELAQNAQCTTTYHVLSKRLPTISINNMTSENEIAKKYASLYSNSKVEINTALVKFKNGIDYTIIFNRFDENQCDIHKRNCLIRASYTLPMGASTFSECIYYFDKDKKIVPDENTQKALDKGLNIFKYL